MSWNEILGHRNVLERFRRAARKNRLASTYLFVGPPGIGKRTFALKLAQALLCETQPESELEPCGGCPGCAQVRAESHPDLIFLARPSDRAFIPLNLIIGDPNHRMQSGLCHDISLKPSRGKRKIAIIDDADFFNVEGANALLKTLEEPPPGSILILIGSSQQHQLPTIVSRSQVVHFQPLSNDEVQTLLETRQLVEPETDLRALAVAAQGSIDRAVQLADPEIWQFRQLLLNQLATLDPGQDDFAKTLNDFVEQAGKDAASRRNRFVDIGDLAIEFYQQVLRLADSCPSVESDLTPFAQSAWERFAETYGDSAWAQQASAACIERTMEMQQAVRANAAAPGLIGCWLSDLGRLCRGELPWEIPTMQS